MANIAQSYHHSSNLGCEDFVPHCLDPGSQLHLTAAAYESFGEVLRRARMWIAQQGTEIRVTNIQSIDYKIKHTGDDERKYM